MCYDHLPQAPGAMTMMGYALNCGPKETLFSLNCFCYTLVARERDSESEKVMQAGLCLNPTEKEEEQGMC